MPVLRIFILQQQLRRRRPDMHLKRAAALKCPEVVTGQTTYWAVIRKRLCVLTPGASDGREPCFLLPLLARQWDLSTCDAAYLQLALARRAPLVTLDARLATAYDQAAARSGRS